MANKFGRVDSSETTFEEQTFNKGQTLTSSSLGVNHFLGLKDNYLPGTFEVTGCHSSIA